MEKAGRYMGLPSVANLVPPLQQGGSHFVIIVFTTVVTKLLLLSGPNPDQSVANLCHWLNGCSTE